MTAQNPEALRAQVQELEAQLESIGAGGVEPLRKANHLRGATKMVGHAWGCSANAFGKCDKGCTEAHERLAKDALNAARYLAIREDADKFAIEFVGSQRMAGSGEMLDRIADEAIAARAQAQQGGA